MEHLIHTFLVKCSDDSLAKYEIYSQNRKLDHYDKVPEGTCRVISYRLNLENAAFDVIDADLNIKSLFEANRPEPNTWYSDGPHRVTLQMVLQHLKSIS